MMAAPLMTDERAVFLRRAVNIPDVSAAALCFAALADSLRYSGDLQGLIELKTTVLGEVMGNGQMDRLYALGGFLAQMGTYNPHIGTPAPYRWGLVMVKGLQDDAIEGMAWVALIIEEHINNPGNVNDLVTAALKGEE